MIVERTIITMPVSSKVVPLALHDGRFMHPAIMIDGNADGLYTATTTSSQRGRMLPIAFTIEHPYLIALRMNVKPLIFMPHFETAS